MANVQIRLNVAGGQEAERQLRGVAAGEKAVGDGAKAAAKPIGDAKAAKAGAAQATRELDDRNRTLAERFRALGPEAALVGDAIDSMALKEGKAAAAVGVLGVAVLGLTMLYQQWSAAEDERAAKAKALIDDITEQAKAYDGLAEAIDKVRRARLAEGNAVAGQAAAGLLRRTAAAAAGVPVGRAGIQAAAAAAGGGPRALSGAELADLVKFQFIYGHLYTDPAELLDQFMAFMQSSGARKTLDALTGQAAAADPLAAQRAETEQREVARSVSPPVLAARGLEDIARRETAAGRPLDVEALREMIRRAGEEEADIAAGAAGALARRERFGPDPEGLGGLLEVARRHPGLTSRMMAAGGPAGVSDEGQKVLRQVVYVLQGTNYVNADRLDPAGVPVPTGME